LPGTGSIENLKEQCTSWKPHLEKNILQKLNDPGVWIEDKDYSLAIHYRNSRQKKRARSHILSVTNSMGSELRVVPGKLVFNLIPPRGPHKGIALSRVMKHAGARFGFYIGDDYTDEDVFEMADHRVLTVRVGNTAKSQAQYFVRRQSDINQVLRKILKFHSA
jgi:trehalose 6-phosphate phosphatase